MPNVYLNEIPYKIFPLTKYAIAKTHGQNKNKKLPLPYNCRDVIISIFIVVVNANTQ